MKADRPGRPEAILIAGPTASGKSALAMRLAERLDGIVLNADSMQVYADLRILTARPDAADERRVPHALYGTVDGAANHSVSLWLRDLGAALERARTADTVPVIVGGTGLYLKALTDGLSDIPAVPDAMRAEIRHWAATRAPRALHAELARRDPDTAARLRPTDPQRLIRALEVQAATGRGLASFHAERNPPLLRRDACCLLALAVGRDALREAVDRRLERMVGEGALAEVEALAARDLDADLPIMRALGVKPLMAHVRSTLSLDAALEQAKAGSRRYLKRQDTFVRTQLGDFSRLTPEAAEAAALAAFGLSS